METLQPADRTIGRNECMNMEEFANWLAARGGNTTKEILEYHASLGHFQTYQYTEGKRKYRVVTVKDAEQVLMAKPPWISSAKSGTGIPAGYVSLKKALRAFPELTEEDVRKAVKGGTVRFLDQSTRGHALLICMEDVRDLNTRRIHQRQREQRKELRMSNPISLKSYIADRKYGAKFQRALVLPGYLPGITIKGEGTGRKYLIDAKVVDAFISEHPGLQKYLDNPSAKVTKKLREMLEQLKAERESQPESPPKHSTAEVASEESEPQTHVPEGADKQRRKEFHEFLGLAGAVNKVMEGEYANEEARLEAGYRYWEKYN